MLDTMAFAPLTAFLAEGGVDGVLACGTTGEGVLLSVAERRTVTELFLDNRPAGFQVAVHAGAQTTADTVALAAHARRGGRRRRRRDRAAVLPARRGGAAPPPRSAANAADPSRSTCTSSPDAAATRSRRRWCARCTTGPRTWSGMKVSDSPFEAVRPYLGARSRRLRRAGAARDRGDGGRRGRMRERARGGIPGDHRAPRARPDDARTSGGAAPRTPRGHPVPRGAEGGARRTRRAARADVRAPLRGLTDDGARHGPGPRGASSAPSDGGRVHRWMRRDPPLPPVEIGPTGNGRPPRSLRRAIVVRLIFLAITLFALYVLWPSLITVFRSWPQLLTLNPIWYPVMVALETASFICAWGLHGWRFAPTAGSRSRRRRLAGNAVSRSSPAAPRPAARCSSRCSPTPGIADRASERDSRSPRSSARGRCSRLPLLSVPAALLGRRMPSALVPAAAGRGGFRRGFVTGWVLFVGPRAAVVGRAMQWVRNRLLRKRAPRHGLPDLLVSERDVIGDTLEDSWWKALLFALGNWLFDYLALLAAIAAVGVAAAALARAARVHGVDGARDDPDHARADSGSSRRASPDCSRWPGWTGGRAPADLSLVSFWLHSRSAAPVVARRRFRDARGDGRRVAGSRSMLGAEGHDLGGSATQTAAARPAAPGGRHVAPVPVVTLGASRPTWSSDGSRISTASCRPPRHR